MSSCWRRQARRTSPRWGRAGNPGPGTRTTSDPAVIAQMLAGHVELAESWNALSDAEGADVVNGMREVMDGMINMLEALPSQYQGIWAEGWKRRRATLKALQGLGVGDL